MQNQIVGEIMKQQETVSLRKIIFRTARGDMLFLSVEDLQGTLDAILFPEVYRQAKTAISSTKPFLLTGILQIDTERGEPFLRVEKVVSVK